MRANIIIVASVVGITACSKASETSPGKAFEKSALMCKENQLILQQDRIEEKNSREDQLDNQNVADIVTPTMKLHSSNWPDLEDDLNYDGLEVAIDRQIKRYNEKALTERIKLGDDIYRATHAKRSLIEFKTLLQSYRDCSRRMNSNCLMQFNTQLKEKFHMYVPKLSTGDPRYGEEKQALFTAYYTPIIHASTTKTTEHQFAIFNKPSDSRKAGTERREIDFRSAFQGSNLELYFADNLFDLYLLHVQGGGRILYNQNGQLSSQYISYAGANGKKWNFISNYMLDKKMIENASIQAQREYLEQNPARHEEIYSTCPSYVYFKKTNHQPLGNDSVPLTDNRSIATDTKYYKFKGLLTFVQSERPQENTTSTTQCRDIRFLPFSRFFLDQDTGGAIRGKARADLYFGEGDYAELTAYNLVRRGDIYFLMLKN